MPLKRAKLKRGDRVMYDGHPCEVLELSQGKVVIRDQYGYRVTISRKIAKPIEPE